MIADIPALTGPLSIDWGEMTSTDTAGGKYRQANKVPTTILEAPGFQCEGSVNCTSAETRRLGLAAQGTAK